LAPGASITISITVQISYLVPGGAVLTNVATVEYQNAAGIQMPTEIASADTVIGDVVPPNPPTDLKVFVTPTGIRLEWAPSDSPDVSHYAIYLSNDPNNFDFGTLPFGSTTETFFVHDMAGAPDVYYVVRAVDYSSNEDNNTNIVGRYGLNLRSGWNLVSLPLLSWDSTLEAVFGANLTGGTSQVESDKVYKWDPVGEKWLVAYMYEDGGPWDGTWIFASGSFDIQPDVGYWVWIRDDLGHPDALVNVTGAAPGQRSVALSVGWNLVGYTSVDTVTLEAGALDVSGLFASGFTGGLDQATSDRVFGWSGTGWKVQYMYDVDGSPWDGTWMGTTFDLAPGRGYWVQVRESHSGFVWEMGG
jgi:hypothetical protein